MDITIHASFLPHDDAEAALAFYRDTLGFKLRLDVGYKGMRCISEQATTAKAPTSARTKRIRAMTISTLRRREPVTIGPAASRG